MNSAKKKIKTIVGYYIKENPEEFEIVKRGIEAKRRMLRNDFATLEGSEYQRALFEIPETLSTMLIMSLEEEETVWFKTKQGAHWFCKTFPVFQLPRYV